MSRASHPILQSLKPASFQPFTVNVANTFLKISPSKLSQSIDLGLDALNSVPTENIAAFTNAVKDEFSTLKADSCTLVPLPPVSLVQQLKASKVAASMDSAIFFAYQERWGASYAALDSARTDSSVCLPSPESLEKLALAQAEVGRAIGRDEAKRFDAYTSAMLKSARSVVQVQEVLPLLDEASRLANDATPNERSRFADASKSLRFKAYVVKSGGDPARLD